MEAGKGKTATMGKTFYQYETVKCIENTKVLFPTVDGDGYILDSSGRVMGSHYIIVEIEVSENPHKHGWNIDPASKYRVNVTSTRDWKDFGALQREHFFLTLDEAKDHRTKMVNNQLKRARALIAKKKREHLQAIKDKEANLTTWKVQYNIIGLKAATQKFKAETPERAKELETIKMTPVLNEELGFEYSQRVEDEGETFRMTVVLDNKGSEVGYHALRKA